MTTKVFDLKNICSYKQFHYSEGLEHCASADLDFQCHHASMWAEACFHLAFANLCYMELLAW